MTAWKEISEIGKSIVKGSAVIVGTKRLASFADRAIPSVAGKGKEAWERVKSTKSTGKKNKKVKEEEPLFEDVDDDEESEEKSTKNTAEDVTK